MTTVQLQKIVQRPKKRLGRGHGSGKVKTSGRGTKGQKARDSIRRGFEGGQLSILHRLPLLRGKGRNQSQKLKSTPIAVGRLSQLPAGSEVTLATLVKYHMIDSKVARVKILGGGTVSQKLIVKVPCSKEARNVIEKAGGAVGE